MHASTRKSFTCISAFIIITLEVWEVCIWRGKDTLAPASAGKAAHGGLADPRPQSFDHRYSPGAEFWWVLPGCIQQKKQGSIHKKNKNSESRDNQDKSEAFVLNTNALVDSIAPAQAAGAAQTTRCCALTCALALSRPRVVRASTRPLQPRG